MRFDELLYNDSVLDALDAMHFGECTPIQEQAIPVALEGRDLLAVAQTGTGKTAAYLLPVIDLLADGGFPEDAINCVVMAPTRELAQQIDQQMQGFAYFMPVSSVAIYGGTDGETFARQKRGLTSGADVVIATPGRLIAHQNMGYVDLSQVSFFILDEADRMLDMGFFDDIMSIYSALPKDCQTLMFSATMPPKIKKLAKQILKDPVEVKIAVSKPADNIDQSVYFCNDAQKTNLLAHLFTEIPPQRVIVFSSSKQKIKELTRELRRRKFNVGEMHSDLDQSTREQVMLDFKANRVGVLLATDIVARGIDIDDITLVVNYDVPRDAEDYVHRIGRTARAASSGAATTFVSPRDRQSFVRIEQLIEMQVPRRDVPEHLGGNASESSGRERRERNAKGRRDGDRRGGRGGKPLRQGGHDNSRSEKPTEAAASADKSADNPRKPRSHRGGRGRGRGNGGAKKDKPSDPQ
ncbi:MAG: DEAD/DEAH box helicase [Muribaculaceae bacterium]